MIQFPKYSPLNTVVKAVKANIKQTQPDAVQLPVLGYIGFEEPTGTKVVIELDSEGEVLSAIPKAASTWAKANMSTIDQLFANFTTDHAELPNNMTLTLVGYLNSTVLTLVDAQLAANGKHSAYWLSVSNLVALVQGTPILTAFTNNALYAEIDFNNPEQFSKSVKELSAPMLWQCNSPSAGQSALVLRDPYRIST